MHRLRVARTSSLSNGVHVTLPQAYDRAAICARGVKDAKLNFPLSEYTAELESLRATPLDQLAATLRSVPPFMHLLRCSSSAASTPAAQLHCG